MVLILLVVVVVVVVVEKVVMVVMVVILMMVVVKVAHLVDKKSQVLQLLRWEVTWLDWLFEDSVHQKGKAGQGACVQSPEKMNSIMKNCFSRCL